MTDIQQSEGGEYLCLATNLAGTAEAIATLIVQEAPSIVLQPQGSFVIKAGEPLKLTCSARGDPKPRVQWEKMGESSQTL